MKYDHCVPVADASNESLWKSERRKVITASVVASILGMNRYLSPLELYQRYLMGDEVEDNEPMYWGRMLEPLVVREFQARTQRKVEPRNVLYRSTKYPFLGATTDSVYWLDGDPTEYPLEAKTGSARTESKWEDGVPTIYMPQVQTQMLVLGVKRASVAVLLGGQKFLWTDVEADDEQQRTILSAAEDFWKCLQNMTPPPPDGTPSAQDAIRKLYPNEVKGKEVRLSERISMLTEQLDEIDSNLKALTIQREAIRQQVQMEMGDAEIGTLSDGLGGWSNKLQNRKEKIVPKWSGRVLIRIGKERG